MADRLSCGQSVWTKSLASVPNLTQSDVDTWADNEAKIPKRKQQQGYSNWLEGYIHDIEVNSVEGGATVRGKSFPSMRKNEAAYRLKVTLTGDPPPKMTAMECDCKAGKGHCSHMIGLLYMLCHYKKMGFTAIPPVISKTALPQTWHIPRRTLGITPQRVDSMVIAKVKPESSSAEPPRKRAKRISENVMSTMYCPIQCPLPSNALSQGLHQKLLEVSSNVQMLKLLPNINMPMCDSKYGPVPHGSVLSYQQRKVDDNTPQDIIKHPEVTEFPKIPLPEQPSTYHPVLTQIQMEYFEGMKISEATALEVERQTCSQSDCKTWHDMRAVRITSSNFKKVCSRQKNFETLAKQFNSGKRMTAAMEHGKHVEHKAAKQYSDITGSSVFLSGLVVNPSAPHLGTSPDRLIYDPSSPEHPYGLLEIKCPSVDSYTQCDYLKHTEQGHNLKKIHQHHHQVMGQMGLTGLPWCDFMVMAKDDYHLERITFQEEKWTEMKEKLDLYFFEHFLNHLVKASK